MTQKKIRLIISLMSFALLGLVAFQAYWLGFMMETKKEQFSSDVRGALEQVVRKLEKQELIILAQKQRDLQGQQDKLASMAKELKAKKKVKTPNKDLAEGLNADQLAENFSPDHSLNRELQRQFQLEIPNDIVYVRKSFVLPNGQIAEITEEYQVNGGQNELNRRLREEQQLNEIFGGPRQRPLKEFNRSNKNRNSNRLNRIQLESKIATEKVYSDLKKQTNIASKKVEDEKRALQKVLQKTEMAKEVFADFLFKERPIEQRVAPKYIDSLLARELKAKDIHLKYVFGIGGNQKKSSYVYASSPTLKNPDIQSATFFTPLFPNDLKNSNQLLQVYFPGQQEFIWQTMGFSFMGSALLLMIMIGCFYIAVNTILKQKKLAEVKNDFINNMTHEFKTPISTISLATQLIQEESAVAKNETILRYLGIIKEENIRLGNQVERVLQTAQMEKEEIVLRKKDIDIHTLIQHVADNINPIIHANQGILTLNLEAQPSLLAIDEVHISNVIHNLLDNAIKYSPNQLHVEIQTESNAVQCTIKIKDQGIGMEKSVLETVFEPFYRVPTGNIHNVKGFGLGLSYVKKIVDAHGGKVKVESTLGAGSTFIITLPYGN
jgi:two-component system phosphate regulon sensor histidine kinase PhoR